MDRIPLFAPAFLCFLAFGLTAQDETVTETKPEQLDPKEVLLKGIDKMVKLNGVSFRTTEAQNSAMSRSLAKQMGGMGGMLGGAGEVAIRGSWADGILRASLNDDADEVLSYRGRMVARNDDVSWKLRRNRTASGGALPFVLDPAHFFEALHALPKSALVVKSSTPSTYKDKQVLILGLTLKGEDAQDFALSGALPPVSAGMGGMMMMVRRMGGAGGGAELPELTVDLALYVEIETGYVLKAKSRSYQESKGAGAGLQVQIRGAGGVGGDDEDEEEAEVQERDKDGKRIYKRGLPVRKLGDNLSRMDFDIIFTKHGMPVAKKVDAKAKKLLRLPQ